MSESDVTKICSTLRGAEQLPLMITSERIKAQVTHKKINNWICQLIRTITQKAID